MPSRSDRSKGLTYLELLVAASVLAVLALLAMPMLQHFSHWEEKRRLERRLKVELETMRQAIDTYKRYVDDGLIIPEDVEQMGYPPDLETLVEGVEVGDPNSIDSQTIQFLRRIPVDPFTGNPEWGLRSYQDDWDGTSWGGENVWDVYSLSDLRALDGTYYRDW